MSTPVQFVRTPAMALKIGMLMMSTQNFDKPVISSQSRKGPEAR